MTKPKWILLAEDDAVIAELAELAFAAEKLPCELIVARDGVEALDCLHCRGEFKTRSGGNPAVVLLDLKMPKLDGLEVLKQVRSNPRLKFIPVVMFSCSDDTGDIRCSYETGANAYILKPADLQGFKSVLDLIGRFWANWNVGVPHGGAVSAELCKPASPAEAARGLPVPGLVLPTDALGTGGRTQSNPP